MWVRNNKGNVFVGNLPTNFTDERLAEAFDPYGIVLSAAVARDPATGARLRYGFVDIATERAMAKAITALDGSEIDGCKLNVKPRERAAGKKAGPQAPRSAGPRPAARSAALNRLVREAAEAPPRGMEAAEAPPRGMSVPFAAAARPSPSRSAESQSARSQSALEGLPQVEPPPRRDFEVVRRPLRRGTPSFQVERRP
jgi:RNA recognition motif-containing protein